VRVLLSEGARRADQENDASVSFLFVPLRYASYDLLLVRVPTLPPSIDERCRPVTLLADLQLVEHQRHAPDQLDLRMILLHSCTRPGDPSSVAKAIDPRLVRSPQVRVCCPRGSEVADEENDASAVFLLF
jgi:hypothetical protein